MMQEGRMSVVKSPKADALACSRRSAGLGLLVLAIAAGCSSGPERSALTAAALPLTDEDIRAILRERVDGQRQSAGMAIGVVDGRGQRTISHGVLAVENARPVDGDTVFPVASITKVFTSLLLADAVIQGKMALEDPVSRHLPGRTIPAKGGRRITLLDLATHTAGLPAYPADYPPETQPAAAAAYTRERLYVALSTQQLLSTPGEKWAYGNFDHELIADALANRMGMPFEELLRRRITGPLGMDSTAITPTTAMQPRLAGEHDIRLKAIPAAYQPAMMASAELLSTCADMMRFVAAFSGQTRSPLERAMALMTSTRRPTVSAAEQQGIGVRISRLGAGEASGHGGNKPGAASFILWRGAGPGVVVLSNAAPPVGDIAYHLLEPRSPLAAPMKAVDVEAAALQRYVGRYKERSIGAVFSVTLEGSELAFELVGQAPKIAMSPERPDAFVIPRLGARIQFRSADTIWVGFAGQEYLADRSQ
jgi:D-alanyl-D-alanine-carboxypeptidase/D-alanyl-D-alanine-endopeptidase